MAGNKYGAKRTKGGWFNEIVAYDSIAEMNRASELQIAFKIGRVTNLQRQVSFDIDVNGVHVCRYVADFVYTCPQYGQVVEDVKGVRTEGFNLKKKLMLAVHGIEVKVVK